METKETIILHLYLVDRDTGEEFLPSRNGFGFANAFKPGKYVLFFNHANGMCGGMVFAVKAWDITFKCAQQ